MARGSYTIGLAEARKLRVAGIAVVYPMSP
jgi:hypothetical protein